GPRTDRPATPLEGLPGDVEAELCLLSRAKVATDPTFFPDATEGRRPRPPAFDRATRASPPACPPASQAGFAPVLRPDRAAPGEHAPVATAPYAPGSPGSPRSRVR